MLHVGHCRMRNLRSPLWDRGVGGASLSRRYSISWKFRSGLLLYVRQVALAGAVRKVGFGLLQLRILAG